MVNLYDEELNGYIEVEVGDFYCNDFPMFFARIGKDSYVRWQGEPIYTVPKMTNGSVPRDGGNLILSTEEKDELLAKNPLAEKYIRRYIGSEEFINNKLRYCLWLEYCTPNELKKMPLVYKHVQAVREFRLASSREATRKVAETSWLFAERRQPKTNYLLMPAVSGERREYISIMVWMRMVAGRLGISYRYSVDVVYNNFPWPPFNKEVEITVAKILSARRNYPEASFADLYDPLIMPKDLRKAHEENDRSVMEAYDFPKNMTEAQMQVAFLKLYERLDKMIKTFY